MTNTAASPANVPDGRPSRVLIVDDEAPARRRMRDVLGDCAQAYPIDVTPARIPFAFFPNQRVPKQQCEDARAALEAISEKLAGHKIPVAVTVADSTSPAESAAGAALAPTSTAPSEDELRREALSDPSVQALFEIFPVEKSKIEEM